MRTIEMPTISRDSRVTVLLRYMEDHYCVPNSITDELRTDPRVELLDRLMAFRSSTWYYELRAALLRIEDGSYGRCMICTGRISPEKLEFLPTSRLCSDCLQDLEKHEALVGAHFSG